MIAMQRLTNMNKLVQKIRALAVVGVVLYHYCGYIQDYLKSKNNYFDFGSVGVQVFFIISGFIIFYLHTLNSIITT